MLVMRSLEGRFFNALEEAANFLVLPRFQRFWGGTLEEFLEGIFFRIWGCGEG